MQTKDRYELKGAVTSVRHRALDLLEDMERAAIIKYLETTSRL